MLSLRPSASLYADMAQGGAKNGRRTQVDLGRNFCSTGSHAGASQPARRGRTSQDEARTALGTAIAGVPEVATGHTRLARGPGEYIVSWRVATTVKCSLVPDSQVAI